MQAPPTCTDVLHALNARAELLEGVPEVTGLSRLFGWNAVELSQRGVWFGPDPPIHAALTNDVLIGEYPDGTLRAVPRGTAKLVELDVPYAGTGPVGEKGGRPGVYGLEAGGLGPQPPMVGSDACEAIAEIVPSDLDEPKYSVRMFALAEDVPEARAYTASLSSLIQSMAAATGMISSAGTFGVVDHEDTLNTPPMPARFSGGVGVRVEAQELGSSAESRVVTVRAYTDDISNGLWTIGVLWTPEIGAGARWDAVRIDLRDNGEREIEALLVALEEDVLTSYAGDDEEARAEFLEMEREWRVELHTAGLVFV